VEKLAGVLYVIGGIWTWWRFTGYVNSKAPLVGKRYLWFVVLTAVWPITVVLSVALNMVGELREGSKV